MWTKHVFTVKEFPVKVYVSKDGKTAVIFYLFGRYNKLVSDENVLDFATSFIFNKPASDSYTFASYKMSLEDTVAINIAA